MPVVTPETLPVVPTVAMAVLLLVHAPPDNVLVNKLLVPRQTFALPDIAEGDVFTVTFRKLLQPAAEVYVMTVVPAATPFIMPDVSPMVAVPVAPLVHVPLPVASVRVVLVPVHTLLDPAIAAGVANTVTGIVALQLPAESV